MEKHVICNQEPGAARFGNFPDYYRFNPTEERMKYIKQLPEGSFDKTNGFDVIECVDIGCNTGELTLALYKWLAELTGSNKRIVMTGLDIDGTLIQCASSKNSMHSQVKFQQCDLMSDEIPFGWSDSTPRIIFCFSVTLWIHLNHGDEGLQRFLRLLAESCDYLLLETQPWKCYRTAVRRAKRASQPEFEHYKDLKIRSDVTDYINHFLVEQCHMSRVVDLGVTKWGRKIILYSSSHK